MDEPGVMVFPSLVRALGDMPSAAVLQQLHYRLGGREVLEDEDGQLWAPITYADLARETGLTPEQARRASERLEEKGVIASAQFEAYNRRKSYRIDHEHALLSAPPSGNLPVHVAPTPLGEGLDASSTSSHMERTTGTAPPPDGSPAPRSRKRGPRDDLFDALVESFGPASTPQRSAFYGRAVNGLVAAQATPDQVKAARAEMRRRGWDKPTPEAMLKHWDDLLRDTAPERRENPNPAARRFWEEGR